MTIKTRLDAIEKDAGLVDPLIVFFRTMLEGKSGEIVEEISTATVATGPNAGLWLTRSDDESFEQFQRRATESAEGVQSTSEPSLHHRSTANTGTTKDNEAVWANPDCAN